jgi:sugar phosphate permease
MTIDQRPTGVRHRVLAFLCGLTFILYLDRMCIGKAMPSMQRELGLSDVQTAYVQAAFTVAYGMFEIVTGHWGDRYGSRRILTRIVLWWSAFTALTGMATSFLQLVVVRFLFGAGEAGALPNAARVTQTWFPLATRGRVRGIVNMPALLGGVVAPPATAYLIESWGWRSVFFIYGSVGVVWAAAFWSWFRDSPQQHPGVNDAERRLIGPADPPAEHHGLPWRSIVRNRNVWLMGAVLISGAMTVYTLFAWYPLYLESRLGVSNIESGWQSGLVMLGGAVGCLTGGWLLDWLIHSRCGPRLGRNLVGSGGYALASAAMLCGTLLGGSPWFTSACFAVACLGIHLPAGAWWSVAADVGGRHIGAFFATINSIGVFGAALAQTAFGYVPRAQWQYAFAFCGIPLAIGALCWALIDTRSPPRSDDGAI